MEERPIYRILLFSKIPEDNKNGWPDYGTTDDVGFYYEYETAVRAMNENWCDIQECMFYAGFILEHRPGLYVSTTSDNRTYFEWDKEKNGFFEAKEPECLKHFSF
jgi:hypothetical protein